jgi:uncharacterized membrane protein YphA (DoxX/SURF4 family)
MVILSVALGLIFIYSGWSKLDPVIETFEFTFVDLGIGNWYTAPVIARVLIGLEFLIGFLLIINYDLRKFTLPLTIALLVFFSIYLAFQIMVNGNDANCGCFGERLFMTPAKAILKNVIMIAAALPIYFFWNGWKVKYNRLFISFFGVSALIVPFVLNAVDFSYSSNNLGEAVNYPLEMDLLYKPEDTSKVQVPKVDLRSGKHVMAFFSLTCSHCRIAAKKFRLIHKGNPQLPIYFILNGDKENLAPFYLDTKTEDIPASFALGKTFINLAGTHLPQMYYIDNGVVVKKLDYFELNQYHIEEWVAGKGL